MNTDRNKYKDLLVIVVGFTIIGIIITANLEERGRDGIYGDYVIYGALLLGVLCIFSEKLTGYVTKAWEKFGQGLGKISSSVLLSVLFILLLTPLALLKKLTSSKADNDPSTNWMNTEAEKVDFEKLW